MIEADKRALKATLTHGISTILGELVGLYSSNLGSLGNSHFRHNCHKTVPGVQTSVIAGLSFAGSVATNFPDSSHNLYIYSLSWFYYIILYVSFVSSVVSLVVTTVSSAFGPSLALTGSDSKTILYGSLQISTLFSKFLCSYSTNAIDTRICLSSRRHLCCYDDYLPCYLQVSFRLLISLFI